MFCVYCGNKLADDARFCSSCGKPVKKEEATEVIEMEQVEAVKPVVKECHVELFECESKWSLFGNTWNTFRVVNSEGEVVMESEKFKVSGFSYDGPEESSKKYREILDKLVLQMAVEGWKKQPQPLSKKWYELTFKK